jgi:hypothetical protein
MANGERFSFDEFKLYYESTEKVTDRRLETNRWNYSICIAILVAIATIGKWGLGSTTLIWVGLASIVVLSIMAMLFCALWVGQIRDFKKLNNAKFDVLNEMAPRIEFDIEHPGIVSSYTPFDREWKKLSALNALDEVGRSNVLALKSSNIEYFIPKAFGVLFVAILIAVLVVVAVSWPPTSLVERPADEQSGVQGQ